MATINLTKVDTNVTDGRNVKVVDVLREARKNHNELVDAVLAINDYLRIISDKLDKIPADKIADFEDSIEFNAGSVKTVTDKLIPELEARVDINLTQVKTDLLVAVKENKDQLTDMEGHSRRKNIIINGIPYTEREDVETLVRTFFSDKLEIEPLVLKEMLFRDTHRLKAHKLPDGRVLEKPIIVAFISQKHRNLVMRSAFKLEGTDISMKTDLPKPLNDLRNRMLKERRRLKTENPNKRYRISEVGYRPILQRSNGTIDRDGTEYTLWLDMKFKG